MKYDFTSVFPNKEPVNPFIHMMGVDDPEVLPHGIAEMRFALAPAIKQAMHQVVDEENFGYQPPDMAYTKAVVDWMKVRHHWDVDPQWICQTSGVVCAIGIAIRAYTQPGDKVLIQTPLYGPFRKMIEKNGRVAVENRLINHNGVYTIDFEDFAAKAREAKLFLLCSPHNPTGRVWSK